MRPWVERPFPNLGHKVSVPGTPGWQPEHQDRSIAGQGHRSPLELQPAAPFLPTSPLRSPLPCSHAQSSPLAPSGKGLLNLAGPLSLLNGRAVTSLPSPSPARYHTGQLLPRLSLPGVSVPASQADRGLPAPFPSPAPHPTFKTRRGTLLADEQIQQ